MADEKIGIEIQINGATKSLKSVKDLKDAVTELEKKASESDYGSDEYKKATAESEKLRAKMEEISGKETTKMATSLKALQQEYKKLKVALSEAANPEEFARISQELNDVEGKIGDINDAASIATGSGIEQLNKGIGLIGEGFRNFDFEKIKIGFKGIGNAMNAIAPLALIAAIGFLIDNFEEIVFWSKKITGSFTEQELKVQDLTRALEVQTAATIKINKESARRVELLTAEGGKEIEILALKKQAIESSILQAKIDGQLALAKRELARSQDDSTEALVRTNIENLKLLGLNDQAKEQEKILIALKKERTKEETKTFESSIQNILDLENAVKVLDQNEKNRIEKNNKEAKDASIKLTEDKKKQAEIDGDARFQAYKAEQERLANEEAIIIPEQKEAIAQTELEINAAKNAELLNQSALLYEANKKISDKELADKKAGLEKIGGLTLNAAKGLSDAVFAYQLSNTKKGSAEELKIRKQAFQLDKAFAVAKAGVDGTKAVLSTFADTPGGLVIKSVAASLAGVIAAANIAKIASAKFDGGASSGSVSAPSVGSGSTTLPTPPTINQSNTTTQFDEQGNNLGQSTQRIAQEPIKVFVTENDITEVQKRSDKLKVQTTF